MKGEKEPLPDKFDPRYPVPGSKPPAVSLSPLTLAALAYRGIKNRIDKNKAKKKRQFHSREIAGNYSHKDKDGNVEILDITITLRYKNVNWRKN